MKNILKAAAIIALAALTALALAAGVTTDEDLDHDVQP